VQNGLQVDPATGKCYAAEPNAYGVTTDPGCVPLDIFNGLGSITPAMSNYIRADGFQQGSTEEQILGASATGDLGHWGGRSPLAGSPVQTAFGVEWRSEFLALDTDREFSTGDLYGYGGAVPGVPLSGFNSSEAFGEINIPLIEERPFAEDLAINAGYRYASYNTAGPAASYKYGVEWQPVADIRLRGLYERAVRAPNVLELFTPVELGGFAATDPCSLSTAGQCAHVPNAGSNLLICPSGTSNTTCNDETGGNLHLNPEKGRTATLGLVLAPQFLEGFSATVDYFNIRVDDYISTIDPLITLAECYGTAATQSSEAYFCPLIHRNPQGQLFAGGYVSDENTNTGFLSTTGVDVQMDYALNLEDWDVHGVGSLSFDLIGTALDSLVTEPVPGQGSYDCAGLYGAICGGPAPRWRHRLRITWSTPWDDIALSFGWRHFGSVALDSDLVNPFFDAACGGAPCNDAPDARISSFDYLDVALDWPLRSNVDLRAGVNNIFAREPPIVDSLSIGITSYSEVSNVNAYPGSYDALGRTIFMSLTIKA
jgi:outer membrane receptor protein involved in Fe transport